MAGVRLRSQRRHSAWIRIAGVVALALVGGAALWSALRTSEAHAARQRQRGTAAQGRQGRPQGKEAAAGEGTGDGASKAAAETNLDAWMRLTDVGGGGSGSKGATRGGGGARSDAAQQQSQQEQQQQQRPAEQQREQPGVGAAAGGGQAGSAGSGAAAVGGYVTVELKVPKAPPTYNSWVQSEDMLLFHLAAMQPQLEQAYIGMALAAATGRGFILPQFQCFCQNAAQPLPRCRRPDSSSLQFPAPCPEGDVLMPLPGFASGADEGGMPLAVEPHSAAAGILPDQVLVLRPSATILWPSCADSAPQPDGSAHLRSCTGEGTEGDHSVLSVPPSLNDTHLLPFLKPYAKYKLWQLDFSDVGSPWHAFAGWECAEPARKFDHWLSRAAQPWPAPSGGGMQQVNMTAGRSYSAIPGLKDCPPGTNAAGGGGAAAGQRRLQRQQGKRWRPEDFEL